MAIIPYDVPLAIVLTANQQVDLQFQAPAGQRVWFKRWFWTFTGAFSIVDVRVQTSTRFTSASIGNPILSTFLRNPGNANIAADQWEVELQVDPQNQLSITVKDTSGVGNTVSCLLRGRLDTQAGNG